jgi:hypothetical protein
VRMWSSTNRPVMVGPFGYNSLSWKEYNSNPHQNISKVLKAVQKLKALNENIFFNILKFLFNINTICKY